MNNRTIKEWQEAIHACALKKGWWKVRDGSARNFGEILALMHSELSEALEAYREGRPLFYTSDLKPEGIATELADCIIRILDWAEFEGVDMGAIIEAKHVYNKTRPYRHGGKKA